MAKVVWHGAREFKRYETLMETKLTVLAAEMVADIQNDMRKKKYGIDYRKKWRRAGMKRNPSGRGKAGYFITRSSAPGESPATQHGTHGFLGSVTSDKPDRLRRRVGTNMKRGIWFEFGTKHMKPRPWLRVALERIRPRVMQLLSRVG